MEVFAVTERNPSGLWDYRIAVLTVSGISAPRHRWVKSRVCPALEGGHSHIGGASGVSERDNSNLP